VKLTLADYWMGRDLKYAAELTSAIRVNAAVTVERANRLLAAYTDSTGDDRHRTVNSGWRPPAVNAVIRGAAKASRHMTGEAVDIEDDDDSLDEWCMTGPGQDALIECGLWLEHPDATPRWAHVQSVPPRSGNRVFRP
jgi:hypothetical protein